MDDERVGLPGDRFAERWEVAKMREELTKAQSRVRELESRLLTRDEAEAVCWFIYHCELNQAQVETMKHTYKRMGPITLQASKKLQRLYPGISPWKR
jgi:hypothetical protein